MTSGERPIGTAKGKQPDTEALCHPAPPLWTCWGSGHRRHPEGRVWKMVLNDLPPPPSSPTPPPIPGACVGAAAHRDGDRGLAGHAEVGRRAGHGPGRRAGETVV